jgi:RNA recognition motif-containing protein
MSTKLYVGNLAYATTDEELTQAFAQFGNIVSTFIPVDRATGQSRGFGFVEYESPADAQAAIDGMNGAVLSGRTLTVNVARERTGGGGGGGGGRPRGGGGGGGGRGPRRDRDRRRSGGGGHDTW